MNSGKFSCFYSINTFIRKQAFDVISNPVLNESELHYPCLCCRGGISHCERLYMLFNIRGYWCHSYLNVLKEMYKKKCKNTTYSFVCHCGRCAVSRVNKPSADELQACKLFNRGTQACVSRFFMSNTVLQT